MAKKQVRIKMLRSTIVDGEVVGPGKDVTVDESVARMLFHTGKAELIEAKKREKATKEPPETATQPEPQPTHAIEGDLVDLVGDGPGQALAAVGITSIADAKSAIDDDVDLTEIPGVGQATVDKIAEA